MYTAVWRLLGLSVTGIYVINCRVKQAVQTLSMNLECTERDPPLPAHFACGRCQLNSCSLAAVCHQARQPIVIHIKETRQANFCKSNDIFNVNFAYSNYHLEHAKLLKTAIKHRILGGCTKDSISGLGWGYNGNGTSVQHYCHRFDQSKSKRLEPTYCCMELHGASVFA